jgi:hypothetical protein
MRPFPSAKGLDEGTRSCSEIATVEDEIGWMLESPVDRVWHEGLWIPTCLGTSYLRHDERARGVLRQRPTRLRWPQRSATGRIHGSSSTTTTSLAIERGSDSH